MSETAEPTMEEALSGVLASYEGVQHEMIPILQDVQDVLGYLPRRALQKIAGFTGVPVCRVYGVITFYSQFHMAPQGRHRIKVCQGTACHVRGAGEIIEAVSARLGIKPGETTEDFEFTVESVACFGSCALAPVMVVNAEVHGNMTPEKVTTILEELS